ncbi:hypothetical protein [Clostridium sp.]
MLNTDSPVDLVLKLSICIFNLIGKNNSIPWHVRRSKARCEAYPNKNP